jgi:hypothetical protein
MIERTIKQKIRKVFNKYRLHGIYVYMPVPGGYGESSLDYLGFIYGHGFAVEAKRPGGKPTPRQEGIIERIQESGAIVFVVSDDESLASLDDWLLRIVQYKKPNSDKETISCAPSHRGRRSLSA